MKLSIDERKLLKTLSSLASKLIGGSGMATGRPSGLGRRAGRSREESAQMKKDMLAAVKKGRPVAEIASEYGVTSPYIYQLMSKAGLNKKRKSK